MVTPHILFPFADLRVSDIKIVICDETIVSCSDVHRDIQLVRGSVDVDDIPSMHGHCLFFSSDSRNLQTSGCDPVNILRDRNMINIPATGKQFFSDPVNGLLDLHGLKDCILKGSRSNPLKLDRKCNGLQAHTILKRAVVDLL